MFKKENINPKVQKALYRKIDAMDRLALKEDRVTTQGGQQGASSASEISNNKSFFIGNALEPQDRTNPIEQHLYRGTFAKVSVAVPEFADNDSDIITKPISISSYITNKEDSEKNIWDRKVKPSLEKSTKRIRVQRNQGRDIPLLASFKLIDSIKVIIYFYDTRVLLQSKWTKKNSTHINLILGGYVQTRFILKKCLKKVF